MKLMAVLAVAALVLLAACSDTEEQVDSPSPTAAVTPTASPAGSGQPTLSPTPVFPAQTAIEGGLAPDGCNETEKSYTDPDGRFAVCYSSAMEAVTVRDVTASGTSVMLAYPPTPLSEVSVVIGWEETPAYTPCSQTMHVVKSQHLEKISVSGTTVEACVQEIYDVTRPNTYLHTNVDFAMPRKDGAPILVEVGFPGDRPTRDGFAASVVASRVVSSIKVY
jgi:hypothetical protein